MGLIEKWRESAKQWNNLSPVAAAYDECIVDLTDASTPRPPKAEWFEKWDAWCLIATDGAVRIDRPSKHEPNHPLIWRETRRCGKGWTTPPDGRTFVGYGMAFRELREISGVVPVAREGFPTPVSWSVVGG